MAKKKQAKARKHRAFGSVKYINESYFAKCNWCGSPVDFDFDCTHETIDVTLDMAASLVDFQDVWNEWLSKYTKLELARIQDALGLSWSSRTRNRIARGLTTSMIEICIDEFGKMHVKFYLYSDDSAFPEGATRFYIGVRANSDVTFTSMELEGGD